MKKSVVFAFMVMSVFVSSAFADGGFIPFDPNIDVSEPGQKAIIGWNGEEEILILSIDAYASEATTALQIVPLPSEPEIEAGDFDSFYRIQDLIMWRMPTDQGWGEGTLGNEKGVEVIFHEQIGAHDVMTVHVSNWADFASWLEGYLTARDMPTETISTAQDKIAHYLARDVNYFVFDLVDLNDVVGSKDPLIYTFETDSLYYPLVISTLNPGYVDIKLFVITHPKPGSMYFDNAGFDVYTNVDLTLEDIEWIEPKLGALFGETGGSWVTVATYEGPITAFTEDLDTDLGFIEQEPVDVLTYLIFGLFAGILIGAGLSIIIHALPKVSKK